MTEDGDEVSAIASPDDAEETTMQTTTVLVHGPTVPAP